MTTPVRPATPPTPPSEDAAPVDPEVDLASAVWRELRRLVLEEFDRRKQAAAEVGVSVLRVKALGQLSKGPRSMRELADKLAVDAPHMTVIVDELEGRGLVQRKPHPTDRRSKLISLTPAGRRAAAKADRILNTAPEPVAALGQETLSDLAAILRRISPAPS